MKKILTLTAIGFFLASIMALAPNSARATDDFALANQIISQTKIELDRGNFAEAARLTNKLFIMAKNTTDLIKQKDREIERRADRRARGQGRELEADDRRQADTQIKGADQQKAVTLRTAGQKNVVIPSDILSKAEDFLSRSKSEFSAGRYREAEKFARSSKSVFTLARADIANLVRMRDNFEIEIERHEIEIEMENEAEDRMNRREGEIRNQLDEKQTKVQAEIVGNAARARVEVKFGTNSKDQNVIAQEILDKMKLTRDRISRLLVIQNRASMSPDDLRERLEVKARVSTGKGEVEAKLRFPLSTADRNQIIDGIFARTQALTVQDILRAMEFRNDSDKNNKIAIKGGEIRVTAETLASGSSLAKVEIKFGSTLTDKNAIVQEMVNRMKLSRDEISRLLIIQSAREESLTDRLEAKSVVRNNASENETKLRTPLTTIDKNRIIDGIFARTQALTAQDILNVIDFRTQ